MHAAVQGGEDPFTRMDRERQENAKKTNGKRPAAAPASGIPATVKLTTKLDAASARGQIAKGKALKPELKQASYLAGVSTASMGKFDSRLKGEKDSERKLPGMRKKLMPVVGTEEGAAVSKVLGKVVRCAAAAVGSGCAPLRRLRAILWCCHSGHALMSVVKGGGGAGSAMHLQAPGLLWMRCLPVPPSYAWLHESAVVPRRAESPGPWPQASCCCYFTFQCFPVLLIPTAVVVPTVVLTLPALRAPTAGSAGSGCEPCELWHLPVAAWLPALSACCRAESGRVGQCTG